MAATFTTAGDWHGKIRSGYETATNVAGKTNPPDGYLYRRRIYTIERERSGQGLTAFTPNVGNTTTGDNLSITNGPDTVSGNVADEYLLLTDDVLETPPGSGLWVEMQVAVSYTDWELWEIPT